MLTVTPKTFQAAIRHGWQHARHRPIMCWGPPGASKTASAALVAQEMGVDLLDVRLGDLTPQDLRGLPVIDHENGATRYYPPAELPRSGEGILTLDEINLAPPALQGLAQQLVLARRLGDYRLPEGWLIVAMGNRKEDRAAVHAMPAPVANRFKHYLLQPSVDDWTEWALKTRSVHEHILAFLRYRPELLHKFDANAPAWPSPRSWHIASDDYRHGGSVVPSVGEGPGLEFEAYLQVYQQLPDIDAIIGGRGDRERAPTEPSTRYALTMALAGRSDDHDSAKHALEWALDHLSDELTQLYLNSAYQRAQGLGIVAQVGAAFTSVEGAIEHLAYLNQVVK